MPKKKKPTNKICEYRYSDETCCERVIDTNYPDSEGRDYCIFHSRNEEKAEEFYKQVDEIIDEKNLSAWNALTKPESQKLSEEEHKKKEKEIRGENCIVFEGFYFPGKTEFSKKEFIPDVRFYNATFSGEADFIGATFSGEADFLSAKFDNYASFSKTTFSGEAFFSDTTFSGEASFSFTIFRGEANFSKATFSEVAYFIDATFNGETNFHRATFSGVAEFSDATISGKAVFISAVFNGEANFRKTAFSGNAVFVFVTFGEAADFLAASFSGVASFFSTIFSGKANIGSATFNGVADFGYATFHSEANFGYTNFRGAADYTNAKFQEKSIFNYSNFTESVDFTETLFSGSDTSFDMTRFQPEKVIFHRTVFNCPVFFRGIVMKDIRFTGCYLGGVSFYECDVRDTPFINCSWERMLLEFQLQRLEKQLGGLKIEPFEPKRFPWMCFRRYILYDEVIFYKKKKMNPLERFLIIFTRDISKRDLLKVLSFKKDKTKSEEDSETSDRHMIDQLYLESLYCQFKVGMDKNKSFVQANEFYFGEKLFERKRLFLDSYKSRKLLLLLKGLFLGLYWFLAGYGNRPIKTVVSFFLLLVFFSCTLITCDLVVEKESAVCIYELDDWIVIGDKAIRGDGTEIPDTEGARPLLIAHPVPKKCAGEGKPTVPKELDLFGVFMWNLSAALRDTAYSFRAAPGNGFASLFIFFIQYIFRPLMVALVIISVRRKVVRG